MFLRNYQHMKRARWLFSSVSDPVCFRPDPDPDPCFEKNRIRIPDPDPGSRIRILDPDLQIL